MTGERALRATLLTAIALAAVEFLWEAWLAPLTPGGSWLAIKAVPVAAFAWGLARGRRRALQWLLLLLPWYLVEALVRALTEAGRVRVCASTALVLAAACLASGLLYFRTQRTAR